MKSSIKTMILFCAILPLASQAFLELPFRLYGNVLQVDAGTAHLLQTGTLEITFVNTADTSDRSTHSTPLGPAGPNGIYSYFIDVPQHYLATNDGVLRVAGSTTTYRLQSITIDGSPALPLEPDQALIDTRFDLRALETRLDLRIHTPMIDSDGDGLPDWWEERYGLNPLYAGDATLDADSDSLSNASEFSRGTDPTVANDALLLQTVSLRVYELSRSGLWLDVVGGSEVGFQVDSLSAGFELQKDAVSAILFTLADAQQGRMSILHTNAAVTTGTLVLSAGGLTHTILLQVYSPSSTDGRDATLWLDGRSLTGSPGALISVWDDRSGSFNSAMMENANLAPVLATGSGADFASQTARLPLPAAAFPAGPHSIFSVYQATPASDAQALFASNTARLSIAPADGAVSYPSAEIYQSAAHRILGAAPITGGIDLSMTIADGPEGYSARNRQLGGVAESAIDTASPVLPAIGGVIATDAAISAPFGGILHELLVYPSALSSQRATRVADYLQAKWQDYVVWDYSDSTHPIALSTSAAKAILRGGWSADVLSVTGAGTHLIDGGPGDDQLTASPGRDRFTFDIDDAGIDQIANFDPLLDVLDLSALFPAASTDIDSQIQFITDGLDTRIIIAPGDIRITLVGIAANNSDRNRWIGEGILQTGGLRLDQTVRIAVARSEAIEFDGSIDFIVTRSGFAGYALDVPIAVAGDAVRGVDFELVTTLLSFAQDESQKTITVSLLANNATDGEREIRLSILPRHAYKIAQDGGGASVMLGDGPQVVSIQTTVPDTTEGEDPGAEFRLLRQGPTDRSLSVAISVLGLAQNGGDYPFIPGIVTFPVGASDLTIDVTAYADQKLESSETVEIVLLGSAAYDISGVGRATVQIHDFTARVSLSAIAGIAQHAGNIPGYFLLTRRGNLEQDMVVSLSRSGTATNGVDHAHIHDFARFAPGSASVLVPVTPIGGPTGTGNKTVVLSIVEDSAYLREAPFAGTVTIVDDRDSASVVTVTAGATYASEDGPVSTAFTLSRSGSTANLITVNLGISGTAENGIDYSSIPRSFAIPANQSQVPITIVPLQDGFAEQLESVLLSVQDGDDYLVGSTGSANLFIEDLSTRVTIEAEQAVATLEGPVSGRFVLRRNKGIAAPLSVTLDVSGTADAGDYAAIQNPVTFLANSAEAIIEITPVDTGETHDVTVMLSIAASNGFPPTDPGTATVTIDRDAARAARSVAQRITVTPLRPTVGPGTGEAGFLLERSGELTQDLSVRLSASGVLANGEDYSYISPIAIFPPGERTIKVLLEPISWNEGAVVISASPVTAARSAAPNSSQASVQVTRDGLASINVVAGWNMLSLPLDGPEMRAAEIFGNCLRSILEFTDGDYQEVSVIEPTHGYWMYSDESRSIELPGRYRISGTREVLKGWQMVGPLADNPALRDVDAVWAWNATDQRYVFTDRDDLRLNRGYMVYVPEEAELNLGL